MNQQSAAIDGKGQSMDTAPEGSNQPRPLTQQEIDELEAETVRRLGSHQEIQKAARAAAKRDASARRLEDALRLLAKREGKDYTSE